MIGMDMRITYMRHYMVCRNCRDIVACVTRARRCCLAFDVLSRIGARTCAYFDRLPMIWGEAAVLLFKRKASVGWICRVTFAKWLWQVC